MNLTHESSQSNGRCNSGAPAAIHSVRSARSRVAFTLIELLVVIAIIGVLVAFIMGALKPIAKNKAVSTARAELGQIETALDNYKSKYGVYPPGNKNPAVVGYQPALLNQLYYELSGVTRDPVANTFTTLDGAATIPAANFAVAFGTGGVLNCTKGGAEDTVAAQNFLPGLKAVNIYYPVTNSPSGQQIPTTILVTAARGPDAKYQPLLADGLNPIRYVYPGVQNPGGYDLWVQLVVNGQTNLVCNWSKAVQVNTPFP